MAKQSKAAKLAAEIRANVANKTAVQIQADRAEERSKEHSTSTTEHGMVLVQPTKSQEIMIEDGLPEKTIVSDAERENGWKENPPKPMTWNETPAAKETSAEVLAFAAEEKAKKDIVKNNRLAKLNSKSKSFDPKTHRWDAKNNRAVPLPGVEQKKTTKLNVTKIKKAAEKKAGIQKKATPKKVAVKKEVSTEGHSQIAIALGVKSVNRRAALDKLNTNVGKPFTTKVLMKAVYGDVKASDGAFHTVMKALVRDITNKGAKFEIIKAKDKEEITYGLYSKK